jgi:8-oxo-dGTP pyrophosphatase MutT (NUDIX family)
LHSFKTISALNLFSNNIGQKEFVDFCHKLQNRVKGNLPGEGAHMKMSSRLRTRELEFNNDASSAKLSSVLILLYFDNHKVKIPFILRPKYDGVHSGQISFPGGSMEENDESPIHTALREAQEELNINPKKITVLGTLSEMYIPPSNFLVTPVLAYSDIKPDFIPQASEVEKVIEADISFLLEDSLKKTKNIYVRNTQIKAPYYDVNNHTVWGATAMMLSELESIIKSVD